MLQARTVAIAQIAKTSGFDRMFIDCEHSSMGLDTAAQISTAALTVGVTPVVRVAGLEHWHASRMLDNGAQGIVFPPTQTRSAAPTPAASLRWASAPWAAASLRSATSPCPSAMSRAS